jgi:hypothetical protein
MEVTWSSVLKGTSTGILGEKVGMNALFLVRLGAALNTVYRIVKSREHSLDK